MKIVIHSKKSVSTKVSIQIVPFQQEFPNVGVWCKKWSNWTSESDKKSDFDSQCCKKSDSDTIQKPPTPAPQPWYQCQMLQQIGRFRVFDDWRFTWQRNL